MGPRCPRGLELGTGRASLQCRERQGRAWSEGRGKDRPRSSRRLLSGMNRLREGRCPTGLGANAGSAVDVGRGHDLTEHGRHAEPPTAIAAAFPRGGAVPVAPTHPQARDEKPLGYGWAHAGPHWNTEQGPLPGRLETADRPLDPLTRWPAACSLGSLPADPTVRSCPVGYFPACCPRRPWVPDGSAQARPAQRPAWPRPAARGGA